MRAFLKVQPKTDSDIKCNKDCMIRAVAIATKEPYEKVHKIMYSFGWRATRSTSKGHWEDQITGTLKELGFTFERISFPAERGKSRMTAKSMNESGVYLLRMSKHIACLDNGILKDTWDCSAKCVYFAWKISKDLH